MILNRVIPFAHQLLTTVVHPGDIAIDATVGNGNDTLLLANLVGINGKVYGFDIQEEAIIRTTEKLRAKGLYSQINLIHSGHEHLQNYIPPNEYEKITAAIFNLGYLPSGDHNIVTKPQTTITAVSNLLEIMPAGGLIILVVYHGHPEGKTEKKALLQFAKQIDQKNAHVLKYEFINQINDPPFIIAIEKR
ncbi:class I SAM-dependent methyltransferase [Bacillus kwashiorkori]|uniref:class I SAM-dependent methyltransferase n=1 Tax=Bacillus kwashiorkori TaxID=1522318 RepID=UPI000781DB5F|nr:class I SAM-dependent methyltransferase [Bacillus kwashiorkori]